VCGPPKALYGLTGEGKRVDVAPTGI
jgi:hypothetical protein